MCLGAGFLEGGLLAGADRGLAASAEFGEVGDGPAAGFLHFHGAEDRKGEINAERAGEVVERVGHAEELGIADCGSRIGRSAGGSLGLALAAAVGGGAAAVVGVHAGVVDELGGFLEDDGAGEVPGLDGFLREFVELLVEADDFFFGEVEHGMVGWCWDSGRAAGGLRWAEDGSSGFEGRELAIYGEADDR